MRRSARRWSRLATMGRLQTFGRQWQGVNSASCNWVTGRLLRLRAWPLSAVLAVLTPGHVFMASPLQLSVRPLSELFLVVGRLPRLHVQRLLRAGLRRWLCGIDVCRVRYLAGRVGFATSLPHAVGSVAALKGLRSVDGLGERMPLWWRQRVQITRPSSLPPTSSPSSTHALRHL